MPDEKHVSTFYVERAYLTMRVSSLETVKAVADYLRRAANEPELRFQAPESPRA